MSNSRLQVLCIALLSILVASIADHGVAAWIRKDIGNAGAGSGPDIGTYRRIGPEAGPQVFCAGSSLLQFDLSWREVSDALGQGVENWGVAGSSPEIWELSQRVATNSNLMIIGVSAFDLNEHHLAEARAVIVPLGQTVHDLWDASASWQFSRRLLSQYPMVYLRKAFPTVGNSDAVLVGLRSKVREQLGLASAAEDRETALFLPSKPVLEFGESTVRVSDWTAGRLKRRLALVRAENGGRHSFNGPKRLAFHRMLSRARQQGRVIVVVLPVTQAYVDEFVSPDVAEAFERAIADEVGNIPEVQVFRLDRVPGLPAHDNFMDLVHLNSAGRRLATAAFLNKLQEAKGVRSPVKNEQ
jgi:hypothetical protein